VLVLGLAALLGACGGSPGTPASKAAEAPTETVTTVGPPVAPGEPGELISATPIEAPPDARAWRLVYHSRDAAGRDIAVTGMLLAAGTPTADRPLISYGHPTTGAADVCAPSVTGLEAMPLTESVVHHGWALVMSDYEGLGSSDPHPYLVGASAGHVLLDAARAARAVPESGVTIASPVALLGFSQGGHAAAFAGELAPAYAPELNLTGVALAAPVSDVTNFARRAEGLEDQLGVLATIVAGFAHVYPELDPAAVFTDDALPLLAELEQRCIGEVNERFTRPIDAVVRTPASTDPRFATRFEENKAGRAPLAVPALVVQGGRDPIVDPADTRALVDRYCALGVAVEEVVYPDRNHGVLAERPFVDWIARRFAGDPGPPECTRA
jgi:alpha-beta hydrolase superfamily lysophospholipase